MMRDGRLVNGIMVCGRTNRIGTPEDQLLSDIVRPEATGGVLGKSLPRAKKGN